MRVPALALARPPALPLALFFLFLFTTTPLLTLFFFFSFLTSNKFSLAFENSLLEFPG